MARIKREWDEHIDYYSKLRTYTIYKDGKFRKRHEISIDDHDTANLLMFFFMEHGYDRRLLTHHGEEVAEKTLH